jgi:hypothetical protein
MRDQPNDSRKRIRAARARVRARVAQQRVDLLALDTPDAKRRLTEFHRKERKQQILTESRAALDDARQALILAGQTAVTARRASSVDAILRNAMFVQMEPLEHDGDDWWATNQHRIQVNERRLEREQMTRIRWRLELPLHGPEELGELALEAAATQQHALLHMIKQEYGARRRANPNEPNGGPLSAVGSALVDAEKMVEERRPKESQDLADLAAEADADDRFFRSAVTELADGSTQDLDERVELAGKLGAEFGPKEGAILFAAARDQERREQNEAAAARAEEEIINAILTDEDAAAAAAAVTKIPAA